MAEKKVEFQESLINNMSINPVSYYKNIKISPQGGSNVTISTSTQISTIEIPGNNVVNFSKMAINFTLGAVAGIADLVRYINTSYCPWFTAIELLTSQNLNLVRCNSVDKYSKLNAPCNLDKTKRSDVDGFMYPSERVFTQLASSDGEADPPVITYAPISLFYASRTDASADCNLGFAFKTDPYLNATAIVKADSVHDYGITRCQSIIITGANAGENALPVLSYSIKLKDLLPDTIFNVDRDIYLASSLILKLTWNMRTKIACQMDEAGLNGVGITADLALTNVALNHYIQANPEIVALKIAESQKQMQIIIPELNENSMALSGSTQQTTTKIISNTNNSRLYKSYAGLFKTDDVNKLNNSQNHGLVTQDGGARASCIKFQSVEARINGNQILNLNADNNEDYDHTTNIFDKHSFTSLASYKECGVIPILYSPGVSHSKEYNNNELKGESFGQSNDILLTHSFGTTEANHTHYVYTVLLKPIFMFRGILSTSPFA